jgi:hypothetical protein
MFTIAMAVCALFGAAESTNKGAERFWWVFIERTPLQVTLTESQSQEMMNAHLGNFRRLFGLKKLALAGPLRDPEQKRRGIVLLTVGPREEITESFKPDLFFQQKIFSAHAIQMKPDFGQILRNEGPDSNSIEENRLVVFERGKDQRADDMDKIGPARNAIRDGAASGLAFHAVATGGDRVREIAVFRGKNDEAIGKWLQGDPAVASGALKATVYPQFLGKGFLQTNPSRVSSR